MLLQVSAAVPIETSAVAHSIWSEALLTATKEDAHVNGNSSVPLGRQLRLEHDCVEVQSTTMSKGTTST